MSSLSRFATVALVIFAGCSRTVPINEIPGPQFEPLTVKGRVVDTDGKPIVGAIVVGQNQYCTENYCTPPVRTETDENGEYILKTWMEDRSVGIGVWKVEMMAMLKTQSGINNESPLVIDFTMKPAGKPITVKVIDKEGNSVNNGVIVISRWGNQRNVTGLLNDTGDRGQTNENGRWTWNEAPEESVMLDIFFSRDTYMSIRQQSVVARDEDYVFVAIPALQISGKVIDAETGNSIPQFNVYFGRTQSNGKMYWNIERNAGADGVYSVGTNEEVIAGPCAVKIGAIGYEPMISRNIAYNEESITIDFSLTRSSL